MSNSKGPNVLNKQEQVTALASDIWVWAAIVLVIIAAAVIRSQLLSVPFERDEGEYAYMAQEMLKGVPPYVSAYSMKLPGIYVVYALIMAVFGQTHTAVHLGLLIFNMATTFVVFLLAKKIFGSLGGVMAGSSFAVISLISQVTGLWANSEHFVILPALLGIMLICNSGGQIKYSRLLIAGVLLGFAFIIKQHGIFFAIFAALYLFFYGLRQRPISWAGIIITQLIFVAGAIMPFVIVCLFFWYNGYFDKFWFWTFTAAGEYATSLPLSYAWEIFSGHMELILKESYPIWISATAGIFAVVIVKGYRQWAVFTIGLFIFSFLAVCPGFYFREHYFIFLLPALAILAGAGLAAIDNALKRIIPVILRVIVAGAIGLVVVGYTLYNQREYLFSLSPEEVCRKVYGANPFPESLRIAEFISNNSDQNDTVGVLGSEPQICFYAGRRSATSHIYMYPLMHEKPYAQIMQKELISQIEKAKPKFMIFTAVSTSWLPRAGSPQDIFLWFDPYIKSSYDMVGMINIPMSGDTIYYWNDLATGRSPESPFWVAIFKCRQ